MGEIVRWYLDDDADIVRAIALWSEMYETWRKFMDTEAYPIAPEMRPVLAGIRAKSPVRHCMERELKKIHPELTKLVMSGVKHYYEALEAGGRHVAEMASKAEKKRYREAKEALDEMQALGVERASRCKKEPVEDLTGDHDVVDLTGIDDS